MDRRSCRKCFPNWEKAFSCSQMVYFSKLVRIHSQYNGFPARMRQCHLAWRKKKYPEGVAEGWACTEFVESIVKN
jgi:hypothetical protein